MPYDDDDDDDDDDDTTKNELRLWLPFTPMFAE